MGARRPTADEIHAAALEQAIADFIEADRELEDLITYARVRRAVRAHRCFALGLSARALSRRCKAAGHSKSHVVLARLLHVELPDELAAAVATGGRVDF
ncbi:MAG: hypothetical protein AB7G37_06420 [Solirubrobacteraceae bacterium]